MFRYFQFDYFGVQQLASPYNTTQHGVLVSNVETRSVLPSIIAGTIIGSAGGCIIHVNYILFITEHAHTKIEETSNITYFVGKE